MSSNIFKSISQAGTKRVSLFVHPRKSLRQPNLPEEIANSGLYKHSVQEVSMGDLIPASLFPR